MSQYLYPSEKKTIKTKISLHAFLIPTLMEFDILKGGDLLPLNSAASTSSIVPTKRLENSPVLLSKTGHGNCDFLSCY